MNHKHNILFFTVAIFLVTLTNQSFGKTNSETVVFDFTSGKSQTTENDTFVEEGDNKTKTITVSNFSGFNESGDYIFFKTTRYNSPFSRSYVFDFEKNPSDILDDKYSYLFFKIKNKKYRASSGEITERIINKNTIFIKFNVKAKPIKKESPSQNSNESSDMISIKGFLKYKLEFKCLSLDKKTSKDEYSHHPSKEDNPDWCTKYLR